MQEIPLDLVIEPDVLTEARRLDPDAFAAINTTRHCGTSARRITAIDQARKNLGRLVSIEYDETGAERARFYRSPPSPWGKARAAFNPTRLPKIRKGKP